MIVDCMECRHCGKEWIVGREPLSKFRRAVVTAIAGLHVVIHHRGSQHPHYNGFSFNTLTIRFSKRQRHRG